MGTAMTRNGHVGWRVAAMVAFAGTAALAVILTRAPMSAPADLSSTVSCPTSGLQAWIGLGSDSQAKAGAYYTLEFTNVSHRTCSLDGYPEVSAYAASQATASAAIGDTAIRDTAVRPQPVTLQPGATAHSVLRVAGIGRFRPATCMQVIAQEIRVALPGQGRSVIFPVHFPLCSKRGQTSLSVQAIQARPGIPGRTMP